MGYYKKSPSFGLPVQLRYVFPFFSINFKKLFTFFFNCDIFNRAWGYSSVGRALASHVRGQGFDSPYLHHLPKDPIVRVFFLSSRADGGDNGSAPPMTRFSRQSGCTRSRLDTSVSRRTLTAIAVRRLPFNMVSPSTKKIRSFGSIFVLAYFTGCLRVSLVFVYNCISSQYFCKIFV